MKRSMVLLLILALVAAMSVTAFATEATENVSGNSQEVLASYEKGNQDKTVVSVDISWQQMSFTYRGESAPAWNAEEHRYEGENTEAGWAPGNGIITICNNSNTILQAQIGYEQKSYYTDVYMNFTEQAPYIGSAYTDDSVDEDGNVCGTPCAVTVKAIPMGTLPEDTVDNTAIGTIKIVLSSEVNVDDMLDSFVIKIEEWNIQDISGLSRGTPYFVTGTDANGLQNMLVEVMDVWFDDTSSTPEKNAAINKLLTSVYGALEIAQ